mmetsp:Transcript_14438/g.34804  ORF Transcript_14438/g.34804 Transcript_14438/m.34804 type:complete len:254 (+) Transcript_14438:805-1566(+)
MYAREVHHVGSVEASHPEELVVVVEAGHEGHAVEHHAAVDGRLGEAVAPQPAAYRGQLADVPSQLGHVAARDVRQQPLQEPHRGLGAVEPSLAQLRAEVHLPEHPNDDAPRRTLQRHVGDQRLLEVEQALVVHLVEGGVVQVEAERARVHAHAERDHLPHAGGGVPLAHELVAQQASLAHVFHVGAVLHQVRLARDELRGEWVADQRVVLLESHRARRGDGQRSVRLHLVRDDAGAVAPRHPHGAGGHGRREG